MKLLLHLLFVAASSTAVVGDSSLSSSSSSNQLLRREGDQRSLGLESLPDFNPCSLVDCFPEQPVCIVDGEEGLCVKDVCTPDDCTGPTEVCRPQLVQCVTTPCDPVPSCYNPCAAATCLQGFDCVLDEFDQATCVQAQTSQQQAVSCDGVDCGATTDKVCILTASGPQCVRNPCDPDPCDRPGEICRPLIVQCFTTPCDPVPDCINACAATLCFEGFKCVVDADGSPNCVPQTCDDVFCTADSRCVDTAEGFKCVPIPCENVQCAEGEECKVSAPNGEAVCEIEPSCSTVPCPGAGPDEENPFTCIDTPNGPLCLEDVCANFECDQGGYICQLQRNPDCPSNPSPDCPPLAACVPTVTCSNLVCAQPEDGPLFSCVDSDNGPKCVEDVCFSEDNGCDEATQGCDLQLDENGDPEAACVPLACRHLVCTADSSCVDTADGPKCVKIPCLNFECSGDTECQVNTDGDAECIQTVTTTDPCEARQCPQGQICLINGDSEATCNSFCFPGDATVMVRDKGIIPMSNLEIGDYVKVRDGTSEDPFERVYSFGHKDNSKQKHPFLEFTVSTGESLVLSQEHMVALHDADGSIVPASLVKIGDELVGSLEVGVQVTAIRIVHRPGAYAPFTPSGYLLVNGIRVSNYVAAKPQSEYFISGGLVTNQYAAHVFTSVHRLADRIGLLRNREETYTTEGLSTWVARPYSFVTWLMNQHSLVSVLVGALLVVVFTFVYVIEQLLAGSPDVTNVALLVVTGYLTWRALHQCCKWFVRRIYTKRNKLT